MTKLRKRHFVSTKHHTWAYITAGDPSNPPLILIHGFMSFADYFNPIISRLQKSYYLIVPDLPGFGFTKALPENTIDAVTTEFIAFCKSFTYSSFTLFGVSVGGLLAMMTALKEPKLIDNLVVQSPLWRASRLMYGPLERFELLLASFPSKLLQILNTRTVSQFLVRTASLFKPHLQSVWSKYENLVVTSLSLADFRALKRLWLSIHETDISDTLDSVTTRSLVITSVDDQLVPLDESVLLLKKLKYSELVTLPSGGHELLFSRPYKLSDIVSNFLR